MLSILYQDDALIAVDKPAGQLVHPADDPKPDDLVTMKILRDQIGQQVNAVHRLDRPTSGVLLFTTDPRSTRALRRSIDQHQVHKTYHAIIDGSPSEDQWTCQEPIQKTPDSPLRDAQTHFRVLSRLAENLTLIEAIPQTGRYHQIRRHLLHCGLPIVGDYRYAGYDRSQELSDLYNLETRMLLQCKSLTFPHPISKKEMTIEAPLDSFIKGLTQDSPESHPESQSPSSS